MTIQQQAFHEKINNYRIDIIHEWSLNSINRHFVELNSSKLGKDNLRL